MNLPQLPIFKDNVNNNSPPENRLINTRPIYNRFAKLKSSQRGDVGKERFQASAAHKLRSSLSLKQRKTADLQIAEAYKNEAVPEDQLAALLDYAPVMIWFTNNANNFTYFNKSWLEFTRKYLKDEMGKGWLEEVHPEDVEILLDIYASCFDAKIDFETEFRLKRFDQSYRWILNKGIPRYGPRRKFLGYIGISVDITERKNIERKKDDFISIASHELKTPLTIIKSFNQILLNMIGQNPKSKATYYLKKMDNHIDKLTQLVSDLLDVTKIEKGKLEYKKEFFNLNEVIEDTIEDIQATTVNHQINFIGKSHKKIFGDKQKIKEVLINLLINAVKYSPVKNKEIKRVNIEIVEKTGSVWVSVQDFGIGIPKQDTEKIFERFYRADTTIQETYPGLGLGLFISSEIIKRHGGKIWVKSQKGKGSIFYFCLPYAGK